MRDRIIKRLANLAMDRTGMMLSISALLFVLALLLSSTLGITMRWSDILPAHDPRTAEFDRILKEFKTASSIVVVVQGEENRIKAFADDLAPRLLEPLQAPGKEAPAQYVSRVDYKMDVDFMREHGFMLIKAADLENLQDIYTNPDLLPLLTNINESFEKEYIETDQSLSTREKEDGALVFLNGLDHWLETMETAMSGDVPATRDLQDDVDYLLLGEPYFLSYDRSALILNVIPSFSMMDLDQVVNGTDAVQALVDDLLGQYPDVDAGLSGSIPLGRDEYVYGTQGLEISMSLAMLAIAVILMLSFRMWVGPLMALLNLVVGLTWAMGVSALMVDDLNIMTTMFMVILAGLGIDFSIHILSTFSEFRSLGTPLREALEESMLKTGKGILTGAITTAFAFFALMIGESRGMSEMGMVTGSGLLAVAIATFIFLPSLLASREKRLEKKAAAKGTAVITKTRDISMHSMGRLGESLSRHWVFTLLGGLVITVLMVWSALHITFDYNYMNMEPEGLPSITLQDTIMDKFDLAMDFAYLVGEDVEESRNLAEQAKALNSVASVEGISLYLPSPEQQQRRRPFLESIRNNLDNSSGRILRDQADLDTLMGAVRRLEMNIIEMQSMAFLGGQDKVYARTLAMVGETGEEETVFSRIYALAMRETPDILASLNLLEDHYRDYFVSSVRRMTNPDAIRLEDLPESIVDRYTNPNRDLFLVTVLPARSIWQDVSFLKEFSEDVESVSPRATGMPPVFKALIEIIGRDGRHAAILTLILVFILLWLDFRNPGFALMGMIPLAVGGFWMVGIMHLVGAQLNIVNVMAIPLIIGIGIDDGVHVLHRWHHEGMGSLKTVYASTGKAIFLTSLTTGLAFWSMIFSPYRGYGSLGMALVYGVGACFLTSVIILPGIIGAIESRKRKGDR